MLSPSERDLIRVVVEVVHELRDQGEGEKEEVVDAVRDISLLVFPCARSCSP